MESHQPQDKNVYQAQLLEQESERLRSFDIPTQISVQAIGELTPGHVLVDIGAGENPGLRNYVQGSQADYVALDIRPEPLTEQLKGGALAARADAKHLPLNPQSVDVAHARFVLGHFPSQGREEIIKGALESIKPNGKAVFIDYDWTQMHGSDAVNNLREFTLNNIKVFDAAYGSKSLPEITQIAGNDYDVEELRITSPLQSEYGPALGLRQVTLRGLEAAGAESHLVDEANAIFDALEAEANSPDAPGFYMPDMVAVKVQPASR